MDAAGVTLYRPAEHEPLLDAQWDEARVEQAIASIVAAVEDLVDDAAWPVHPRDHDDGDPPAPTTLYIGAAGVIWALHALGSRLDTGALISRALERWRARTGDLGVALYLRSCLDVDAPVPTIDYR